MNFLKKLFRGKSEDSVEKQSKSKEIKGKKQPENYYETKITDTFVRVTHPSRPVEQIDWSEIEKIVIVNTDEGPFLPDIWLVLAGNGKGCSIPHGSEGWDMVFDIVCKYEGFSFENVVKSASCANNAVFELWKK